MKYTQWVYTRQTQKLRRYAKKTNVNKTSYISHTIKSFFKSQ